MREVEIDGVKAELKEDGRWHWEDWGLPWSDADMQKFLAGRE